MGHCLITVSKHMEENSTCNDLRGKCPRGKPSRWFRESRFHQQVVEIGHSCTMVNVSAEMRLFQRMGRRLSIVSVTLHACIIRNTQCAVSICREQSSGLTLHGFGNQLPRSQGRSQAPLLNPLVGAAHLWGHPGQARSRPNAWHPPRVKRPADPRAPHLGPDNPGQRKQELLSHRHRDRGAVAGPQVPRARARELTWLTLQTKVRLVLGIFPPEQPRSVNRKPLTMLPIPAPSAIGGQPELWLGWTPAPPPPPGWLRRTHHRFWHCKRECEELELPQFKGFFSFTDMSSFFL